MHRQKQHTPTHKHTDKPRTHTHAHAQTTQPHHAHTHCTQLMLNQNSSREREKLEICLFLYRLPLKELHRHSLPSLKPDWPHRFKHCLPSIQERLWDTGALEGSLVLVVCYSHEWNYASPGQNKRSNAPVVPQ